MATPGVKSVTQNLDGTVTVTYTNNSIKNMPLGSASKEISQAKLAGTFIPSTTIPLKPGASTSGTAFGSTPNTGGATNNTVVTAENLPGYYQQALSSKSDGYAKIRKALLGANLITKGTKSLSSVQNTWLSVLQGAAQDGLDPYTYISKIKASGAGLDTAAAQKQTPYAQITEWDPTKAKDYITQLSLDILKREPTPEELTNLKDKLTAAQKKNELLTTYKTDPKTGKVVAHQVGGLDEQQFLTDLIKQSPDYAKVKEAGTASATQQVKDVARANGVFVSDADLANYAERVRNGEKIDDIASTFRKVAGASQPKYIQDLLNSGVNLDVIYSPYKSAMAKTLEIDPNTIDITDPSLSAAVTGDKTMTTYEFQRALRKDPRWQYTDNARSEASDVATQVLKDFGFMG